MITKYLPSLFERRPGHQEANAPARPRDMFELMDAMWREPFGGLPGFGLSRGFADRSLVPSVDVSETETEIKVRAELPGMRADDINLTFEEGVLILQGEKKYADETEKENYHVVERSYGSFTRRIGLPAKVKAEAIEAAFKDGVLTVTIEKDEDAKPYRVPIH